ncbi:nucleoside diphosphate-linked moiety X motif 19-like [Teleopsis dalmanni]|uniref:nucleoside diphosphate-linked moiety X motif 19-like n=1 Tax=Teleopsis dalmanni TaxID=139649 RepID=UPI0018CCFAAE|nr:nucleoside diphosphate-linked moiety X motif 19-like [Teleopsis dalmanni]
MDPGSEFRPSASTIIVAKCDDGTSKHYDYKVLLFKRTPETAYAPDHCVFPGGSFEITADESTDWLDYFQEFGITDAKLQELIIDPSTTNRPSPLMTGGIHFSRDISLRITAIREAFEEVGILLCRDKRTLNADTNGCALFNEDFDRVYWQNLIHNDAKQFIQLCKKLQVVPDLWCLYEWSVWRSPMTSPRKFDTVFYFVGLDQLPNLLLEPTEVQEKLWLTPFDSLQYFTKRTIWLPYIQYYEISRLTNIFNWSHLLRFTIGRSKKGSTLLMPLYYRCKEGLVATLSGDDFYHVMPTLIKETITFDGSLDQFRKVTQRSHRLVLLFDIFDIQVELNIPPIDEHLSPLKVKLSEPKL